MTAEQERDGWRRLAGDMERQLSEAQAELRRLRAEFQQKYAEAIGLAATVDMQARRIGELEVELARVRAKEGP